MTLVSRKKHEIGMISFTGVPLETVHILSEAFLAAMGNKGVTPGVM